MSAWERHLDGLRGEALREEISVDPALEPEIEAARHLQTQDQRFARLRELGLGHIVDGAPVAERTVGNAYITLGCLRFGDTRSWNLKITLRVVPTRHELARIDAIKRRLRVPVDAVRLDNPEFPVELRAQHFSFHWDES